MNHKEFKQALAVALVGNPNFNPDPTEKHLLEVAITHSLNRRVESDRIKADAIASAEIIEMVVTEIAHKIDK